VNFQVSEDPDAVLTNPLALRRPIKEKPETRAMDHNPVISVWQYCSA
jgi:hypothetical protein